MKENFEINIINQFLPKQLNEEEIEKTVKSLIEEKKLITTPSEKQLKDAIDWCNKYFE